MDRPDVHVLPAATLRDLYSLYKESHLLVEILHADLYVSSGKKKTTSNISSGYYFLLENSFCPIKRKDLFLETYKKSIEITLILNELEKDFATLSTFETISDLIHTAIALKNEVPDISSYICQIKDDPSLSSAKHIEKKLFIFLESLRALLEELSNIEHITIDQIIRNKDILLTNEPLDLKGDFE